MRISVFAKKIRKPFQEAFSIKNSYSLCDFFFSLGCFKAMFADV